MAIGLIAEIEPYGGSSFQGLVNASQLKGTVESFGANLGSVSGSLGLRPISFDIQIVGITIVSPDEATVTVDIKKCAGGSLPTTVSIVGAGTKPAIVAARYVHITDFSDWDTVLVSAGDVLEFEVTAGSAAGVIDIQYTRKG
jgi:hypothetical protein